MGGGKGGSVTSTAQIPAELQPLYKQAVSQINAYGKANPLSDFGAANPEQVAGLNYDQRLASGNVPGLFGASPLEALALQSIEQAPALAGVTSTSGTPNFSNQPSLEDYYAALGGGGAGPSTYTDPNVAPWQPPAAATTPTPPTGGGTGPTGPGAGGGGGGSPGPVGGTPKTVAPRGKATTGGMTTSGATASGVGTAPLPPGYHYGPNGEVLDSNGNPLNTRPPINPVPGPTPTPRPNPPPDAGPGVRPPGTGPGNLVEPNPPTADLSQLLNLGGTPQYSGGTTVGNSAGVQAGYKAVTGSDLINDPSVAAALKAFSQTVQPGIQQQAGLMGLGRSDSANRAVATAQGSILEPLYESAYARQQATNDRGYQATETELARRDAAAQRVAAATQAQAGQLAGLAGQRYGELTGAIGTAGQVGATGQQNTQQGLTSIFNDYLRRQGLTEQANFAPFGSVVGGTIGSKSVSTGK